RQLRRTRLRRHRRIRPRRSARTVLLEICFVELLHRNRDQDTATRATHGMAGTSGQTPDTLIADLEKAPYGFDFFQAVRLLQSRCGDRPRIGCSLSPTQDPIRFAQSPSLAFPPSTL